MQIKPKFEFYSDKKVCGYFGSHFFMTGEWDENDVSHILYRHAESDLDENRDFRVMTSIQDTDEFVSFVNEAHSIWMSGFGYND